MHAAAQIRRTESSALRTSHSALTFLVWREALAPLLPTTTQPRAVGASPITASAFLDVGRGFRSARASPPPRLTPASLLCLRVVASSPHPPHAASALSAVALCLTPPFGTRPCVTHLSELDNHSPRRHWLGAAAPSSRALALFGGGAGRQLRPCQASHAPNARVPVLSSGGCIVATSSPTPLQPHQSLRSASFPSLSSALLLDTSDNSDSSDKIAAPDP